EVTLKLNRISRWSGSRCWSVISIPGVDGTRALTRYTRPSGLSLFRYVSVCRPGERVDTAARASMRTVPVPARISSNEGNRVLSTARRYQVDLQQDRIRSYRDARRLQAFIEPMCGCCAWKRHYRD